jgi:hypothetical protein
MRPFRAGFHRNPLFVRGLLATRWALFRSATDPKQTSRWARRRRGSWPSRWQTVYSMGRRSGRRKRGLSSAPPVATRSTRPRCPLPRRRCWSYAEGPTPKWQTRGLNAELELETAEILRLRRKPLTWLTFEKGMSRPLLNSAGRALPVDDAMRLSGCPQVSAWSYAWRDAQPAQL